MALLKCKILLRSEVN